MIKIFDEGKIKGTDPDIQTQVNAFLETVIAPKIHVTNREGFHYGYLVIVVEYIKAK